MTFSSLRNTALAAAALVFTAASANAQNNYPNGGQQPQNNYPDAQQRQAPLCNLFTTMLQRFGANVDRFNKATGTLANFA